MDLYNYGLSGHCFCEQEVVDFLAETEQYDIGVFEVSVNMLTNGYTTSEFCERVNYLLEKFSECQPLMEIFCFGILPHYNDFGMHKNTEQLQATANEYRNILKEWVENISKQKITYIEPIELLRVENLSSDLIHPGNMGMIEISDKLYSKITHLLSSKTSRPLL